MKKIIGCLKYIHCSEVMDGTDYSPPHVDTSRPSLGFPLGIALLLIIIFCLSGIFSCYYHWDKLRSLSRQTYYSDDPLPPDSSLQQDTSADKLALIMLKENENESLPVLMPGDRIPKFIALPCPRQPPAGRVQKIDVVLKKQPAPFVPIPLYL